MNQTARFGARYFDGRSSRPRAVAVVAEVGGLRIRGEEVDLERYLREVEVSERLGSAPRLLRLRDGGYLESGEHDAVAASLRVAGHRDGLVSRVQTRWPWALGALLLTLALIAAGYLFGLPAVAEFAAKRVPPEMEAALGQRAVKIVDAQMFAPSSLPPARQAELSAAFARIAPQDGRTYRLEFRASRIGPNAVALPGGIMVMTDELVKLARSDDEIIAVLAHELGHIEQRHFMRRLISGAIVDAADQRGQRPAHRAARHTGRPRLFTRHGARGRSIRDRSAQAQRPVNGAAGHDAGAARAGAWREQRQGWQEQQSDQGAALPADPPAHRRADRRNPGGALSAARPPATALNLVRPGAAGSLNPRPTST